MKQSKKTPDIDYNNLINEGLIFVKKGDFTMAVSQFEKAIKVNKKNFQAYINLANVYVILKNLNLCSKLLFNYLKNNGFKKRYCRLLCKDMFKF